MPPSAAADLPALRLPWLLLLVRRLAAATESAFSTARCPLWRLMAAPSASANRCAACAVPLPARPPTRLPPSTAHLPPLACTHEH